MRTKEQITADIKPIMDAIEGLNAKLLPLVAELTECKKELRQSNED
jgi:hypothetical protein